MLFAVAALTVLLVDVNAQLQECHLSPTVQEVYEQFLLKANPGLIWNDAMSSQALRELEEPGSVLRPGAPYIHFGAERTFEDKEKPFSIPKKTRYTLFKMVKFWRKIHGLSEGVNYGCNGVYTSENSKDKMKVLCLFQNY
uniref:Putative L3 ES protein n=1 Tax=Ostertagia ostertagi TaxID=6317 RepID=Q687E2_OSTOS|nr:putative L3 ES protein [Ostertagia ostertagi]